MLKFKCPQCQTPITIRNTGGLDQVKIACPSCQRSITVKINKKPVTVAQPTPVQVAQPVQARPVQVQQVQQSGVQVQKDETETVFMKPASDIGVPVLILNGTKYRLSLGHNIVGRESPSSTATLQLPVSDPYMSRSNAFVDVTKTDMGTWQVVISSSNDRNLVKLNGHPLAMGNRIILQEGNRVGLGHTELLFTFDKQ